MRTVPLIGMIALAGVLVSVSICEPTLLAENNFLTNFVNQNYIGTLVVIVTVSLVSITQINLEYSRVERRFKKKIFQKPRTTLNLSAFLLVAILIIGFVLAFFRAQFSGSVAAVSFIHSIAILTILEVIFIMYDLVRTVYALADNEPVE